MFRKLVQHSLKHGSISTRAFATTSPALTNKWDLCAGVLVERHPVLSKSLNAIETKFQSLLSQLEFENSLKSNYETRHEKERLQAERVKKGEVEVDLDDAASKQTVQDMKDAYSEELKKFQLAPRLSEIDKQKDYKSTQRDLEDTLYLLIEQKLGDAVHLVLPQGKRLDGESMRQTAERVLRETCGENIDVTFYGNAPCGFHKYKYPAAQRKDTVGAKVFFFRSGLKAGNVDRKVVNKFEWLDKDDLDKKLKGAYSESVQRFLI